MDSLRKEIKRKAKRLQSLQRQRVKLNAPYFPVDENFPHYNLDKKLNSEINELRVELDIYKTLDLQRKAERFAIDFPDDKSWWVDGESHAFGCLTKRGIAGAEKLIRDERMRRIKQWFELFTVIISLLALAVSVLTLYFQFFGKGH